MKQLLIGFAFLFIANALYAQEVTMFSNFFGTKFYQDDKKLKLREVHELMQSDTQAQFHWKRSNNLAIFSGISALANIGIVVVELTDNSPVENTDNNTFTLASYIGTFIATFTFDILSRSEARKAVLSYNKALERKTTFKLEPAKKGIGIALTF